MAASAGRTAAAGIRIERQLWAVRVDLHKGRFPEVRCKCEDTACDDESIPLQVVLPQRSSLDWHFKDR